MRGACVCFSVVGIGGIRMIDKTGGPAFPFGQMSETTGQPINGYHNDGMTRRDYFAAKALIGYLHECAQDGRSEPSKFQTERAAKNAYSIDRAKAIAADAAPRVLYRQHYAADTPFAAAFRRGEELQMVRNIISARRKAIPRIYLKVSAS
jgi:hypothetical protein